jgi:hypothetical protein
MTASAALQARREVKRSGQGSRPKQAEVKAAVSMPDISSNDPSNGHGDDLDLLWAEAIIACGGNPSEVRG